MKPLRQEHIKADTRTKIEHSQKRETNQHLQKYTATPYPNFDNATRKHTCTLHIQTPFGIVVNKEREKHLSNIYKYGQ